MREELVRIARGAEIDAVDARNPGRPEGPFRGAPEVELAVMHEAQTKSTAERRGDVVPDLVATGADPRADDGGDGTAAECLHARGRNPAEEAAPAGVQHRECRLAAVRAGERDRHAVRSEREHRQAAVV